MVRVDGKEGEAKEALGTGEFTIIHILMLFAAGTYAVRGAR
jgi:hypothetical protein